MGSSFLLDASKVDLPDERFGDEIERVYLLLHLNICYLQWMFWDKEVVG